MPSVSSADYEALAEVRYRIRRFLTFSEAAARSVGLESQQHQLLLAVRGLPRDVAPTVKNVAERLQLQHNSAVELVRRCADNGFIKKAANEQDRRQVLLAITPQGERLLERLAMSHRTELLSLAPALLTALDTLVSERR